MPPAKASSLVDTRVICCGDNLEQLHKLLAACVDLIYIDPPFNSNRNYDVFWGETKEKRSFEDRHESTKAYIDYMRPRCVELAYAILRRRSAAIPMQAKPNSAVPPGSGTGVASMVMLSKPAVLSTRTPS
jgi:hypothetical protein